MNKSAKEMFEELGYEIITYSGDYAFLNDYYLVSYRRINHVSETIGFVYNKTVEIGSTELVINMKILQAINKQIEELNWLEKE